MSRTTWFAMAAAGLTTCTAFAGEHDSSTERDFLPGYPYLVEATVAKIVAESERESIGSRTCSLSGELLAP